MLSPGPSIVFGPCDSQASAAFLPCSQDCSCPRPQAFSCCCFWCSQLVSCGLSQQHRCRDPSILLKHVFTWLPDHHTLLVFLLTYELLFWFLAHSLPELTVEHTRHQPQKLFLLSLLPLMVTPPTLRALQGLRLDRVFKLQTHTPSSSGLWILHR